MDDTIYVMHNDKRYEYLPEYASTVSVLECARIFIRQFKDHMFCTSMNDVMVFSDESINEFEERWKNNRR